jgi:arginyl-tRNA synthetase
MQGMSDKLQQQLWDEAVSFVENGSRKNLAHLGVTLDGVDNQYMELSFTCKTDDEDYQDFIDLLDDEFLQTIRFEYSNVRIQEFGSDIPIEVDYDCYLWQHVIQLSMGDKETDMYNKFIYWIREHEKMTSGFRQSIKSFDRIYLQSLRQMAKQLDVEYGDFKEGDIYDEMILIESVIHEYFKKKEL